MITIATRMTKAARKKTAGPKGRARRVEAADALGVDQLLPDPQAGEEGRGHAAPLAVEELDQVEVSADADDQSLLPSRTPSASPRPRWCRRRHRVCSRSDSMSARVRAPSRRDRRGRSARRRRRAPRRWLSPCRRGSCRASVPASRTPSAPPSTATISGRTSRM